MNRQEQLTNISDKMPKRITTPFIPETHLSTTELDFLTADTPFADRQLRSKAIHTWPLLDGKWVGLFDKLRVYFPSSMDKMLLVNTPDGFINSINDISPEELHLVMKKAQHVFESFQRLTTPDNQITSTLLSYNYHEEPMPRQLNEFNYVSKDIFEDWDTCQRKITVQSLPQLHIHTTAILESDINNIQEQFMPKREKVKQDQLYDPILPLVDALLSNEKIKHLLGSGLHYIKLNTTEKGNGISWDIDPNKLYTLETAEDLQMIHLIVTSLQRQIIDLFVQPNNLDKTLMPKLHSQQAIQKNVQDYTEELLDGFQGNETTARFVYKYLSKLGSLLKSGEDTRIQLQDDPDVRIAVRNPAYTAAIINSNQLRIIPRFVSVDNGPSALRFFRHPVHEEATEEYMKQFYENRNKLKKNLIEVDNKHTQNIIYSRSQ